MKSGLRKAISLTLIVAMVLSTSPVTAIADDASGGVEEEQQVEIIDELEEDDVTSPDEDDFLDEEVSDEESESDQELDEESPESEADDEEQLSVEEISQEEAVNDSDVIESPAEDEVVAEEQKNDNEAEQEEAVVTLASTGKALPATFTGTFTGSSPYTREYKIVVGSAGLLKLDITASMDQYSMTLYDGQHNWLDYDSFVSTDYAYPFGCHVTRGTYYLELFSVNKGSYTLNIALDSAKESFPEAQGGSDNSPSTANTVSLGTTINGQIAINDRRDYYKVVLPSAGRLRINVKTKMDSWWFTLYSMQGNTLTEIDFRSGSKSFNVPYDLTKGTYYIKIHSNITEGNYTFKPTFTSSNESFSEAQGGSNNTMSTANAINLNTSYKGQIALNDTKDYYRFTLPSSGRVTLTCKASISVELRLYDSSGSSIQSYYAIKDKDAGVLDYTVNKDLPKGTYYLLVERWISSDTSGYSFKVSWPFSDITKSTAHYDDIIWMYTSGISTGFSDGTYRPNASVTRADMAAFLYRMAGSPSYSPSTTIKSKFKDVNASTPHAKEIWWLASKGISTGYADRTFRPYSNVARCDMAAFLYRLAGSPKYTPSTADKAKFSDVKASTPHAKEIWWLASKGISTGYSNGTFRPSGSVTRADMAAFLHRMSSKGLV